MNQIIDTTWGNVQNRIEDGYIVSSEKTLVFLFSMEFMKLKECDFECYELDFEANIYGDVDSADTFLDLKIEDKKENKNYALEFKFPRQTLNGNSNQTETRKKVYKDIARLKYLKEKKGFTEGFFLMMTNEMPYINSSNTRDNIYDTSDNHEGNLLNFREDYDIVNLNFKFEWIRKTKYNYLKVMRVT